MKDFEIRKNTLPYIHPYSVVYAKTGEVLGQYKTIPQAQNAIVGFIKYGTNNDTQSKPTDAFDAMNKRLKRPNGDRLPGPPDDPKRHIKLD